MAGDVVNVEVSVTGCVPSNGCGGLHGPVTITDTTEPGTTCTTDDSLYPSCTLVFPSSGVRTLTAVYAGSDVWGPSSDAVQLSVGPRVFALAEGVTGAFFDSYLLLANPGATPEPVMLTLFKDDGSAIDIPTVVPALGRATWKADDLPGLDGSAFSARVTVPSGHPVIAERATYFADDYRAGHASMGRPPSIHQFFAEGCQDGQFDTYVIVRNLADAAAFISVSFFFEEGEPLYRTYTAPPRGRLSIAASAIPELAGRPFGMVVWSSDPAGIERSMYFGEAYVGGHSDAGVPLPSATWLFAEGATGPTFDTYLLLANPGFNGPALAQIEFHTSGAGTVTRSRLLPPDSRVTIDVAREDPRLAATTFWISVRSDVPVVAERAMYWSSTGGSSWTEGHVSAGAPAAGPRWGFAEGIVGGGLDFKTFLLIANQAATPARVDVQYLPTAGSPITHTRTVPAGGRLTIDVGAEAPSLRDVPFGMTVTARDGAAVVAERSIYWTRGGPTFVGGTSTVGLPF
jgi:hypothetical protein